MTARQASYRVAAGSAASELREKGSRFFAFVAPAASVAEAKARIDALAEEYSDATHVCFAWRVGWPPAERAADAGEPAGTAGAPILRALQGAGVTGVVAAVVRYFGGTKLGKGGLARAYAEATRLALSALPTRDERPSALVRVRAPHERQGAVRRMLRPERIELAGERYGAEVELDLRVALDALDGFDAALAELGLVAARLDPAS
jgi:uncharacterized YigZ family protein